jgi:hypothetical protein
MFEIIGNVAQSLASNVGESRRGFLGRAAKAALAVASVCAGLLVFPGSASAGTFSCDYRCHDGSFCTIRAASCPHTLKCGGMTSKLFRIGD